MWEAFAQHMCYCPVYQRATIAILLPTLNVLIEPFTEILDMPNTPFPYDPHLVLAKSHIYRIISSAADPYGAQRQARLRVQHIHNLATGTEDPASSAHTDAIVEVLHGTAQKSLVCEQR